MNRVLASLLLLAGCAVDTDRNRVQRSSMEAATYFVTIDAADGFVPACVAIDVGKTVQWENGDPTLPANVTGLDDPPELYSPNLQGEYATWRHTFETAGFFEYFDTNTGDPGRRIVDTYYGSVTFAGVSPTTQRGAVCVRDSGADTLGACCCRDFDCAAPQEACVANVCTRQ